MSRELGSRIPDDLQSVLDSEAPPSRAVPIITLDPLGYPHVALLSYYEMFLLRGRLHCFLAEGGRSVGNLEKRVKCTLLFANRDFVYYIKGRARLVGRLRRQAAFRIEVSGVSEDFPSSDEGEAALSTGIRFQASGEDLAKRLKLRAEIRESLERTRQERREG